MTDATPLPEEPEAGFRERDAGASASASVGAGAGAGPGAGPLERDAAGAGATPPERDAQAGPHPLDAGPGEASELAPDAGPGGTSELPPDAGPSGTSELAPGAAERVDAALADTPGGSKRLVRALLFPLLRVLEPRFADTNRRLDDTRKSLHEESNLTRWVLEREVGGMKGALEDYGLVSTESLSLVGMQLRELQDEVRALHDRIEELEGRSGSDGPEA